MKKWQLLHDSKGSITEEEILKILFKNRGITTQKEVEEFLNPTLASVSLSSVEINKAAVKKSLNRIDEAIKKKEKIIIFGDYDVDGITGSAILWETLYSKYKNVLPHIPHRVDEGYGLSKRGIDHILDEHGDVGLIITVDNGIVAYDAVSYANEKGIDVVITDHHVASDKLPEAYSIVHTTKLCGAGVAYLLSKEISSEKSDLDSHLELVALATVADLVPLTGANRVLVKFGIESLRKTRRPGLLALFEQAQIRKEEIDVYKIGHIIAPRLNASGRIAHAMDSLRLLCTNDVEKARILAVHLNETNRDRQILTAEATDHANLITEIAHNIIVAHDAKYNQGIIGLVASRLVERHYRPSIVISVGESISKGSARSITGFNIIEFLRTFSADLIDAGGHPMAAGFTIETTKIEAFKNAIFKQASKVLTVEQLVRVLNIDLNIGFESITPKLFNEIKKLAPFGMANFEPVFVSKNVVVESIKTVGREGEHLKLSLSQNKETFDAIFFKGTASGLKIGDVIDVVYSIEQDSWNGNNELQLKIKDVKISS